MRFLQLILGLVVVVGCSGCDEKKIETTPVAVFQEDISVSVATLGAYENRSRVAVDDIATVVVHNGSNEALVLEKVPLVFMGDATMGAPSFGVSLVDPNTNDLLGSSTQATCSPNMDTGLVTFRPDFQIDAGTSKTFKVRINSSSFNNTTHEPDKLWVRILGEDLTFRGSDGKTRGANPESIPLYVANVSYE